MSETGEPDPGRKAPPSTRLTREDLASWLSGPPSSVPTVDEDGNPWRYRGQRLGLPEEGTGSLATFSRRIVALIIDWAAAALLVRLFFPHLDYGSPGSSLATMGFFALEVALFTWLVGASFGHRLVGIGVVRVTGRPPGLLRALFRTVLLCLVIPAVVWDRDARGLHDRWAETLLLRR